MAIDYEDPQVNIYSTPGSAVANALQHQIARRAMEKRQSLLDQVAMQQHQAQMDYNRENLESLKEQRASQAEERKARADIAQQQANQKRLQTFIPGSEVGPESAEWLKTNFPESAKTEPQADVSELGEGAQGPMPPAKTIFTGDRQYQANQRLKTLLDDPDFEKQSPLEKMLIMQSMGADDKFISAAERMMAAKDQNAEKTMMIYDPVTNQSKMVKVPAGTEFHMESRPPQGPQPIILPMMGNMGGQQVPIVMVKGIPMVPDPKNPGKLIQYTGNYDPRPTNATTELPAADSAGINKARADYEEAAGSWFHMPGSTPGKAQRDALNQRMSAGVSKQTKDVQMRRVAGEYFNEPKADQMSSADLADMAVLEKKIPEDQRDNFANILYNVRGK